MRKETHTFLITLLCCIIWGISTPIIFPTERFGMLFLLTAFIGGGLIGHFVPKFLNKNK